MSGTSTGSCKKVRKSIFDQDLYLKLRHKVSGQRSLLCHSPVPYYHAMTSKSCETSLLKMLLKIGIFSLISKSFRKNSSR